MTKVQYVGTFRLDLSLDVGGDQSSLLFVQLDSTIGFRSEAAAYKDCEATSLLTPPPGRGRELRI